MLAPVPVPVSVPVPVPAQPLPKRDQVLLLCVSVRQFKPSCCVCFVCFGLFHAKLLTRLTDNFLVAVPKNLYATGSVISWPDPNTL